MKIKSDDKVLILPLNEMRNRTILLPNENSELMIQYLQNYFCAKKKNKCLVCDDDDLPMDMDEINFIYLGKDVSYSNNMELKAKSVMNNEILKFIESNPRSFLTIDSMRNQINNLETDEGMYKLSKIISRGLNQNVFIKMENFNIQSILEMFSISIEEVEDSMKQLLILNLLLYPLKDKPNIIYLDKDIDEKTILWSKSLKKNDYLIINNESLNTTIDNFDLLKISDNSQIETVEEENNSIKILSYMNHNLIKTNLALQNEKNIKLFEKYNSNYSSFLIKNSYYCVQ